MRGVDKVLSALHKVHSWYFWNVRTPILETIIVFRTKINYKRTLPVVRARVAQRGKVRVVFLVYDLAKWKSQGVLNRMLSDAFFDPIVVMTAADTDWAAPKDIVRKKHADMNRYFSAHKAPCYESYDYVSNSASALDEYEPDIVYYSQPWGYDKKQDPACVSRIAMTCYVPYFVPNYGFARMDCMPLFHRSVYAYFILNNSWADYFRACVPKWLRACSYVATGHPGLDFFSQHQGCELSIESQYVIYAPHWSVPHENNPNPENYSTFLDTGLPMLEYAKKHPEINWVFKPHPTLKVTLISREIWPREQVESYYAEWERLGVACYTGEYQELFLKSKLMITDCGSFLSEYGSTGKPIIWLTSSMRKIELLDFNRRLYDTYYKALSWREAVNHLDAILLSGLDPNKGNRYQALSNSGLSNSRAAEEICTYIKQKILCS